MAFYQLPFGHMEWHTEPRDPRGHTEWHTDPRDPRTLRAPRERHGRRRATVRRPR